MDFFDHPIILFYKNGEQHLSIYLLHFFVLLRFLVEG